LGEKNIKDKLAGKFIVIDGPDGCGKSTQVKMLAEWLGGRGVEAVCFRDPGGTPIGEKIREILLDPEYEAMEVAVEVLVYMASRAQLWFEKIVPALQSGRCVLLDRWLSSTCAYQGYAGGFGMERVIKVACDTIPSPWPDFSIILDVGVKTFRSRNNGGGGDRIEDKSDEYHSKVREGFLQLAEKMDSFVAIDGRRDVQIVHKEVIKLIEERNF